MKKFVSEYDLISKALKEKNLETYFINSIKFKNLNCRYSIPTTFLNVLKNMPGGVVIKCDRNKELDYLTFMQSIKISGELFTLNYKFSEITEEEALKIVGSNDEIDLLEFQVSLDVRYILIERTVLGIKEVVLTTEDDDFIELIPSKFRKKTKYRFLKHHKDKLVLGMKNFLSKESEENRRMGLFDLSCYLDFTRFRESSRLVKFFSRMIKYIYKRDSKYDAHIATLVGEFWFRLPELRWIPYDILKKQSDSDALIAALDAIDETTSGITQDNLDIVARLAKNSASDSIVRLTALTTWQTLKNIYETDRG